MSFELLRELCATPAAPGREDQFRQIVRRELEPIADEITQDAVGNLFAVRKGKSKSARKIMVAAHMDEIALMVRHINKDGFVYFSPLGGFDPRTLVAQRVKVHGRKTLDGCIGIKATHFTTPEDRKKVTPLPDLFIDLGLPGDEVAELVRVGDPITLERELIPMGNFYCGKTLDDRVGVYTMIEAFKRMEQSDDDIYAVATVQEEVGVRGARAAAFGLDPDVGLALDITIAADTPGIEEQNHCVGMDKGVGIKVFDSWSISHPQLVDFLRELAEEHSVRYQMEVLPAGGTDAGGMFASRAGIPVGTLSIPCRYTHSVVESVHRDDVERCIELTRLFMQHSGRFRLGS